MLPREDEQMAPSVDPDEVARFNRLGEDWWNPRGPMRALHQFNPARIAYLRRLIARRRARQEGRPAAPPGLPLDGLDILDIGCGGGLLSEALSRLGAKVTAIDPAAANIDVARRHAEKSGLGIDYLCTTAEALAAERQSFDVVLAMEVIEHVRDVESFIRLAATMVRPQGILVAATLNRTLKSYALAILGAEYILQWVPKGTHRWAQFVTPQELAGALRAADLHVIDETGIVFDPLSRKWRESPDMDVNYIMAAERKG
ncbi:MAG: bifunctional 2-polyprenyl-6-hydroxyphenol methylase/3-demethylubiquinol 3-O-methyltransferase UbiG [Methylovirgula sp.]